MTKLALVIGILSISSLFLFACGQNQVPLPTAESTVWTFMNLIKEGSIPQAVDMLNGSEKFDDLTRQAWTAQFNSWEVTKVNSVVVNQGAFRVDWSGRDGSDTRWINVVRQNSQLWRIGEIATGP